MFTLLIRQFIALPQIVVRTEKNGYITGYLEKLNGEKTFFKLGWRENNVYLRVKKDDPELLKTISQKIGDPGIRAECRSWLGAYILYSWHANPEERTNTFKSMVNAINSNTGIFGFFGWRQATLLKTA